MTNKAGRHRIYSSEERKDRNRTAQAAFRDRRNKYTQSLETALHLFEDKVKTLEASEKQLTERAQSAEHRCSQLESKVADLQRMIETMMVKPPSPTYSLSPTFSSVSDTMSGVMPESSFIPDPNTFFPDPVYPLPTHCDVQLTGECYILS